LVAGIVVLMLAGSVGCGGPAYEYDAVVTGTVLIDGQLANRGTITFHPVEDGVPSIGRILKDGSFSMRTGQGDLHEMDGGTVPPGEYIVTIVVTGEPVVSPDLPGGPPKAGPRLTAAKYASVETSDLRRTVAKGENLFVFDLERAEPVTEEASDAEVPAGGETTADEGAGVESTAPAEESAHDTSTEPAPESSPSDAIEEAAP
jgi:hypothetical protein